MKTVITPASFLTVESSCYRPEIRTHVSQTPAFLLHPSPPQNLPRLEWVDLTSLLSLAWSSLKSYYPLLPYRNYNSRMTPRECELQGKRNKYFQNSILILPMSYFSWLHWIFWNEKQGQKTHILYPILVSQLQVIECIWESPHWVWPTTRTHK